MRLNYFYIFALLISLQTGLLAQTPSFLEITLPVPQTYTVRVSGEMIWPNNGGKSASGVLLYFDNDSTTTWAQLMPGEETTFTQKASPVIFAGMPYTSLESQRLKISGKYMLQITSSDGAFSQQFSVTRDHVVFIRNEFKNIVIPVLKGYTASLSGQMMLPDNGGQPAPGMLLYYDDSWHAKWSLLKPGGSVTFQQNNTATVYAGFIYAGEPANRELIQGEFTLQLDASDQSFSQTDVVDSTHVILLNETPQATVPDTLISLLSYTANTETGSDIFLMQGNSRIINLTNNPANNALPQISNDGRHIAFSSDRTGQHELYVMNIDGANVRRLTTNLFGNFVLSPAIYGIDWSPDDSKLILCVRKDNPDRVWKLYEMNADGTGDLNLLAGNDVVAGGRRDVTFARNTPEGNTIVMERITPFNGWTTEIFSSNSDGSNMVRLTAQSNGFNNIGTSRTPYPTIIDGELKVLFTRGTTPSNGGDIFMINIDGSGETSITNDVFENDFPVALRPNATYIVFVSDRDGDGISNLWRINPDGTDLRQLTTTGASYPSCWVGVLPKPEIVSISAPSRITASNSVLVSSVVSTLAPDEVSLKFRQGGDLNFEALQMTEQEHRVYATTIPGVAVGAKGLEYFVEASDTVGNVVRSNLRAIAVNLPENRLTRNHPGGNFGRDYRLISLPLDSDNSNIDSLLLDDLGVADTTRWRLWDIDQDAANTPFPYREYPNVGPLEAGKSMFLLTREITELTTEAGITLNTLQPFQINLHSGWNMIANPFDFDLPISAVSPESLRIHFYKFDGEWQSSITQMQPWEGYMLKVTEPTTLTINPQAGREVSQSTLAKAVAFAPDWQIQIIASTEFARDTDNFVGVYPDAAPRWDRHERYEPPSIGDFVMVSFPHRDWGSFSDIHTTDFHPPSEEGQVWDFEVTSSLPNHPVNLSFVPSGQERLNWEIGLIDLDLGIKKDVSVERKHVLRPAVSRQARHFKLIVGDPQFVSQISGEFAPVPASFQLEQNFPNPFNPSTKIKFGLPETSTVTLEIYNVLGQKVVILLDHAEKEAGFHVVAWEGKDKFGQSVASGLYFVRLRAGRQSFLRKMTFIR